MRQVVELIARRSVLVCCSVNLGKIAFQACAFNHSAISPAGVPDARSLRVGVGFKWNQQLPDGGDPLNRRL
jgi:hypothetical protein